MKALLIISITLILLSGMANGLHETLVWHWKRFDAKFPSANEQYWNPYKSYNNKCKTGEGYNPEIRCVPKYFGSTSFLVFLTDAKHLLSELHLDFLIAGVMILTLAIIGLLSNRKWIWIFLTILSISYIAQAIGFHLVYTIYF